MAEGVAHIWKLVALVLTLGLDTLAASAAIGASGRGRSGWQLALRFAAAEAVMASIGLVAGYQIAMRAARPAGWIGGGLLVAIGVWMLIEAITGRDQAGEAGRIGLMAVLSVSIDELAAGAAFGLIGASPLLAVVLIALQSVAFTFIGLRVGSVVGRRLGNAAEPVGAAIFLFLGALVLSRIVS